MLLGFHKGTQQIVFGGVGESGFFGTCKRDNDIFIANHVLYILVYLLNRYTRCNLVNQRILGLDTRNISSIGKVSNIFVGVGIVFLLIAFVEMCFVVLKHIDACPFVFGCGEAEFLEPLCFHHHGRKGFVYVVFLGQAGNCPRVFRFGYHIFAVGSLGIHKGRVPFLKQLVEPVVHHTAGYIADVIHHKAHGGCIKVAGKLVVFVEEVQDGVGCLFIRCHRN